MAALCKDTKEIVAEYLYDVPSLLKEALQQNNINFTKSLLHKMERDKDYKHMEYILNIFFDSVKDLNYPFAKVLYDYLMPFNKPCPELCKVYSAKWQLISGDNKAPADITKIVQDIRKCYLGNGNTFRDSDLFNISINLLVCKTEKLYDIYHNVVGFTATNLTIH
jgi:hypothetical protein